jgi:hypothetical protein
MNEHYLAWWNVENLFNVKNDRDRSEELPVGSLEVLRER